VCQGALEHLFAELHVEGDQQLGAVRFRSLAVA
jgi:hypothetical protein